MLQKGKHFLFTGNLSLLFVYLRKDLKINDMDWTIIITSIISLITGGGIIGLFTIGSTKRKASAEAKGAELKNDKTVVESLEHTIDTLQEQIDRLMASNAAKDVIIEEKSQVISKYVTRLQSLYDDMCIHKGCKLRKPHQGMGGAWYETHADDPNLGCDFLSVETLLRNWRKAQKAVANCTPTACAEVE